MGRYPGKERKIKQVIDSLNAGDRLIIPELSRLGRSTLEIMEILSVAKEKGVAVYDVKNGWELNNNLPSETMAMCFSIAARIERDLLSKALRPKERSFPVWCFFVIVPLDPALKGGDCGVLSVQRTEEKRQEAMNRGVRFGRPPGTGKSKLDKYKEEIIALPKVGSRQVYISRKYVCTPATLTNWLKRNEIRVHEEY